MIVGIGMDLVELDRIKSAAERQQRFVDRILTKREKHTYEGLKPVRKLEYLAGRFAAKEAYAKAAGCGIGAELSFQDIEIVPDTNGKPCMTVKGQTNLIHLSITHSQQHAAAQVVIESLSGSSG
ncbi:MAG TPA: holo-ACP synthase [Bacillales bacterium]|nr:holo-ACP synthase [Bacillales bacterium]